MLREESRWCLLSAVIDILRLPARKLAGFLAGLVGLIARAFGVRVLRITLDCTRIGHLIAETDCLAKEVALGRVAKRRWIIFYEKSRICNADYLRALPEYFIPISLGTRSRRILCLLSRKIEITEVDHYVLSESRTAEMYSINALWGHRAAAITCPPDWKVMKREILASNGIPHDQPYVCIHAREAGYSPADESYHAHRNIDITTYKAAIDHLLARGYAVVRMGDPSMASLSHEISGVFDYARSFVRKPWLDLAICSECAFFLGSSSGASFMATVFGRPVVSVGMALPFNFSPSGLPFDMGIPKLMRRKSSGELLSISEIFDCDLSELRCAKDVDAMGYEFVENSPEEILDAAREMADRANGEWQQTPDDIFLQSVMRSYLMSGSYSSGSASACGSLFLRRHRDLVVGSEAIRICQ